MQLRRDYYDNLEVPDFILCKANRERIGIIPCTEKSLDLNFGDLDEIHLKTYLRMNDEINPVYDEIEIMKYILVPNIGFFYIQTCDIESEGTEYESKDIKALSYEGLLGQKYIENFYINTGETGSKELEFDETGSTHIHIHLHPSQKELGKKDLFDYLLEKCPDWYVAYCDPILMEDERSHRSFKVDRQDVYSFIMNDVQDSFECYVVFDTIHLDNQGRCAIYLYAQEAFENDTNIYVSYDNLLNNTDISSDADDIKTCVVLKGQDDFEIREVNFGYDRLYNFEYYNNLDFWSKKLYEEYNAWQDKTYTIGAIERSPDVYTEDISDEDLASMCYLDLYKYRLKLYLEAKQEMDDIVNLIPQYANDEDRDVGSGVFPVFDNDGKEIGSIEFDTDTGVYLCEEQDMPSSPPMLPYSGEPSVDSKNYIFIVKDATVNITTLEQNLAKIQAGKSIVTVEQPPIPCLPKSMVYALQNEYVNYSVPSADTSEIRSQLRNLEKGGSVDLINRPMISTSLLENAGWGKQEPGIATVYTSTYSNRRGNIAMNFTPIKTSGTVISPSDLELYANVIIDHYEQTGTYDDPKKLKVGKTYTGSNAINKAVADAKKIHNLHERLFVKNGNWTNFDSSVTFD